MKTTFKNITVLLFLISLPFVSCGGFKSVSGSSNVGTPPGNNGETGADNLLVQTTPPGTFEYTSDTKPTIQSIAARPVTDNSVYGLYAWHWEIGNETYRNNIAEVGIKSIRLGGPLLEKDQWSPGGAETFGDQCFAHLARMGVEVMYTMTIEGNNWGRHNYATDEAFIQAYLDNITVILNRYAPNGSFWSDPAYSGVPTKPLMNIEIWNEPNFQYMGDGLSDVQKQTLYAKVLSRAYAHIKASWPTVRVIGFGAGGANAADKGFISDVLNQSTSPDVNNSFDVLSTHPYIGNCAPDAYWLQDWGWTFKYSVAQSLNDIRTALGTHGKSNVPIWYTEVGWEIFHTDGGNYGEDLVPKGDTVSPYFQGAYICRLYAWAVRLGVDRVHIMYTKDTDGFNGGIFNNVDPDFSMRKSAYSIKNMIKLMPHPKLIDAISDNVNGYCAYRFRSEADNATSKEVIMVWDGKGPTQVTISLPSGNYRVIDMVSNEKTVNVSSGTLTQDIGPYPIYIISVP